MIEINGQWEQVVTLDDCLRVISYHLGLEFANKVQELIDIPEKEDMLEVVSEFESVSLDLDCAIDSIRRLISGRAR